MRFLLILFSLPTFAALAVMLAGSYAIRIETLSIFAYGLQINPAGDLWLEKSVGEGDWEKIGLIFGWGSNDTSCANLLTAFKNAYPTEEYRCSPVRKKL